ncbi:MAG: MOSC domain-containing protein [Anaerolineae bacterium]|nr:MOSC domain-containing protein [Anaerolineae bacterium]
MIAPHKGSIRSERRDAVQVTLAGFDGDRHAGLTTLAGGRMTHYPRGVEVRNSRQVSILSVEELAEVAAAMNIPVVEPEWLGANLLLEGIPALTLLPPMTRLFFDQDATLVLMGENLPCTTAGDEIQVAYPDVPGLASRFPQAGLHKRGVVAWVERAGVIASGDGVRVEMPDQPPYPGG